MLQYDLTPLLLINCKQVYLESSKFNKNLVILIIKGFLLFNFIKLLRYSLLFNNKIILGIIFYNVFVRSGNLVKDKSVLLYNIIVNNVDLCITSDLVKNCKSLESLFNSMS